MKDVKADERFEQAAGALVDVWCAQDAGERADDAAKLYRRLSQQLAADYGRDLGDVMHMVSSHAVDSYMELV